MARGFWTGLLHGGVVSVLAVAALSLAAPLPQPDPALPPAPAVVPVAPQPAPALAPVPQPGDAPQAGAVDLPVGSEFGRGGDVAPRLPVPLATDRPDQAEAPAVMAPTSEPAPVALTAADPRPQPAGDGGGPVQGAPSAGEDAPRLDRPAALPQPTALAAPDRAAADAPDAAPAVPAEEPAPIPPATAQPEQQIPTPGLPAPVLDLSLPPDLSDLQGLTRD
ncbi:hypothetical protein [Paracoccus sp. SSK6]|uniref:hypothetical protein n=1 Tax=Paracoccus sp. SSK6 TaxID=3143131 RepID=UPI0032193BF1